MMLIEFTSSKFYTGAGSRYDFGKTDYGTSRELIIAGKYEQSSMTKYQNHQRISLDLLVGYEYKITDNIKIFSEFIYYLLWDNIEETITDGWDNKSLNYDRVENTSLTPTKDEQKKYWVNSPEQSLKLGFIFSF